ncbi:MAG: C4-dicarboxylate transporter substrate-binding protein [Betaproteobacteria bacterium]|nr:C4-dicarboxylate transporter substrate-binding protein [Betaproteobacteria bacterium]
MKRFKIAGISPAAGYATGNDVARRIPGVGWRALVSATLFVCCGLAFARAEYKIATANQKGTYFAIGADLARFVAPQADISLKVLPTAGSAANIKHLRYDGGVNLAIVQADVYQAFVDRAAARDNDASTIIKPLRVILPLYNTEIHYIVRADSPYNYIHEIKDARINGGELGSGAALITHTLYRMMFDVPIPEAKDSYLSNEEALLKLIGDKSVDVVVVAGGQPAPLIANMKPEAQNYIKLLKFDPSLQSAKLPLTVYTAATIKAASYPQLLQHDFTTIAVGAYLVTYDLNLKGATGDLTKFARSLCQNFRVLQEKGHPKWREVSLNLPELPPGWTYYGPTTSEIRACANRYRPRAPVKSPKQCSAEERILKFCR